MEKKERIPLTDPCEFIITSITIVNQHGKLKAI